jgi:hypothetical protein
VQTSFVTRRGSLYASVENAFDFYVNMADVIDVLFNGTSMANVPRTGSWNVSCCSTFFIDTSLLWKRPKSEYIKLLKAIKFLTTVGLCKVFPYWTACDGGEADQPALRKNPKFTDNFIIGLVLEKLWGVILTNRTGFPYISGLNMIASR